MSEGEERAAGLNAEIEGVLVAARDAVTDDMIARLAESAGQALELLDRVNSSGVAKALPALAEMVENGDLERLVRLARVYGAAEDAVTDDMVGRLTETVGNGVELLDRVNRSNIGAALPTLSRMVENGDLERIANLARLIGAAEDALTDDMVGRLADLAAESVSVLDRLSRSGVGKLIDVLERLNNTGALDTMAEKLPGMIANLELMENMLGCFGQAAQDVKNAPRPAGGLLPVLRMMRDRDNQAFMQFAFALGRRMQEKCG
ncbi:MAG TPA: hypothetical protein VF814_20540 [Casimicrobiaceae bacterium]